MMKGLHLAVTVSKLIVSAPSNMEWTTTTHHLLTYSLNTALSHRLLY